MRLRKHTLIFVFVVFSLFACETSKLTLVEKRAKRAAESQGDIVIGIVDSSSSPSLFSQGIDLAINEVNQRGGVLGRQIRPLKRDDKGDKNEGQKVAHELVSNEDVIAVVGHTSSEVAIPVSIIYEKNGVLLLSPGASDPSLTLYAGDLVFRNIPNGEDIGRQMADFASRQGYKKVVVFYHREDAYQRLTENFKARAGEHGIEIVTTRSYFERQPDFRNVLSEILSESKKENGASFDLIFIAGRLPTAGLLIKQARGMGIETPVLSTDGLDSPELLTIAGRAAENTIVVTVFDPKQPTRLTREFVQKFQATYGIEPDAWAAQGYDAIQLLTAAIEQSGSIVPLELSSTLRFLEDWEGVTGKYKFTLSGDIAEKKVFFKEVRNGTFEFLERDAEMALAADPLYVIKDITLRLPLPRDVETLDPGLAECTTIFNVQTCAAFEVIEQLFLGLTDLDPKTYEPVPELAEKWEDVNEDGTVYRFYLRKGVTWTDKTPVTAHDVVWAIQRNQNPETGAYFVYLLDVVKNVEALDAYTVEFTLNHPAPYFPALAGTWVYRPLPRHIIERFGEAWTEPENIETNGPYRVEKVEKGVVIILRQNQEYYDAAHVSIPEVRYYIIPSPDVGLAMYEQDELDIIGGLYYTQIPDPQVDRIKADPILRQEYTTAPNFTTYASCFNLNHPPVDNLSVRQAISAIIDRQMLVELHTRGVATPTTTFTTFPMFGAVDPQEGIGIRFDPMQARQLLADAGYPNGEGFPTMILGDPLLQPFLKHYLNIDTQPLPAGSDPYTEAHIFDCSWYADYPDAYNFLHDSFEGLDLGWNNEEFDKLMEDVLKTSDSVQRKAMYKRSEQILCQKDAIVIPLYFVRNPTMIKPRVKGWEPMIAIGGQQIHNWSLQK